MKMLQLIHKNGSITVTDIYQEMRIEQSVTSGFLAMLRKEGFVKATKQKRFVYYSINYHRINQLHAFSAQLVQIKDQSIIKLPKPEGQTPQPKIKKEKWITEVKRKLKEGGM